jgi:uncharacterized protein YacL
VNDLLILRVVFVLILALSAYFLRPLELNAQVAAAAATALGLAIVLFEIRLKRITLKRLIGAAIGSILGIIGAFLISLVLRQVLPDTGGTSRFIQLLVMLLMTYVGLVIGAAKGEMLNLAALGGLFGGEKGNKTQFKLLDTSASLSTGESPTWRRLDSSTVPWSFRNSFCANCSWWRIRPTP